MNNKYLLNLIKTIGIGILGLIGLSMVIGVFSSDEEIESEVKTEIIKSREIEVKELQKDIATLRGEVKTLTDYVKVQKVEHQYYFKNVVQDSTALKEFKKAPKYSYWFFSYADDGYQGFNVVRMDGAIFNFDKAMKLYRDDGKAKQYGGINSIKRISYKEYMSAHKDRRRE